MSVPLLATFLIGQLINPGAFSVPAGAAPSVISGARRVPMRLRIQDVQADLRISEFGERLTGSFHFENQRVTGVSLHNCAVTNSDIKSISSIIGLKSLYFYALDFSGIDLAPFSYSRSLESITFNGTKITDSQLNFIQTLSRLKYITISDCELTGDFLIKIPAPWNIVTLTLSNIKGLKGANIKRLLEVATTLEILDLSSNGLVDGDLEGLSRVSKCGYLRLNNNNALTSEVCKSIRGIVSLRILELPGTLVGDAAVGELSRLEGLEILRLANTPIGDGLKDLAGLDKLKDLDLANTPVGDKGMEGIVRSRNIKKLNLSKTLITDHGLRKVGELKSLEVLKVANVRASDRSVETLTGLTNLVRLDLSGTLIGDGIGQIGVHELLAHLDLSGTTVGDTGVEGLSRCASLVTLDLSGTRVHDNGVGYLAKLGLLEELSLAGTMVGDSAARSLGTFPSLWRLNLASTRIGDDGLVHLFRIGDLTLAGTKITARGVLDLVSRGDLHPTWIDVTDTGITSVGNNKVVRRGDRAVLLAPFVP